MSLYDFRSGKTRKIVKIENPGARLISVSPDGRTILYTQKDQSGGDQMLVQSFR